MSAQKQAKRASLSPDELAERRAAERAEYYSRTGRKGLKGLSLEERAAEIASRMAGRSAAHVAERAASLALRLASKADPNRQAQTALRAAERASALSRHLAKREAKAAKAERKRQAIAARAAHLIALLNGTAPGERISDTEGWDSVTAELRKVWHLSGHKHCTCCGTSVPPEAMLPPGPGNFYEGQCHGCATASYEANRRASLGIPAGDPLPGPPRIILRDGTSVTIGELAARHRRGDASRRNKRFARNWR